MCAADRYVLVDDESHPGAVYATLHRPDRRNALDADAWNELAQTVTALGAVSDGRCLVLTGAGTAFASGGDLTRLVAELDEPDGPERFRARIRRCLEAIRAFPGPTIAAVNGPAIGGGTEIAMSCDVRLAAMSAQFGIPAAAFGIVMAVDDLARLVDIVGVDAARYLTMTGAIVDAAEAHRLGLVHHIVADEGLEALTVRLVDQCTGNAWPSARWFRDATTLVGQARRGSDGSAHRLEQLRRFELECLTTPEFRARVAWFQRQAKGDDTGRR